MKDFIENKLREGRFSTPSEYIRSLIRDDQDMTRNGDIALLLRRNAVHIETVARPSRTTRKHK